MARNRSCRVSRNDWPTSGAKCSKGSVATVSGTSAVTRYDPEMISGAGSQATDIGSNILRRVAVPGLEGSGQAVRGCCSILKIHIGGQTVRISGAVECG